MNIKKVKKKKKINTASELKGESGKKRNSFPSGNRTQAQFH